MKLATLKRGGRDGTLVVVSRDLRRCQPVRDISPTLQHALDHWHEAAPRLAEVADALEAMHARHAEPFVAAECHSPLPRAYQWADASAYLEHVRIARRARGAALPAGLLDDPLIYQGGSDGFLGPCDPIVADPDWGIDFEAELAVITGDVPLGSSEASAAGRIRLVMLANDVSLRRLVPGELDKGFGFFQSKPASCFSPVALTPDELADAWRDARVHLPMRVDLNGRPYARIDAGGMHFSFARLVAHAARTRSLAAGTILGSGTVSVPRVGLAGSAAEEGGPGYCCLLERRLMESIEAGRAETPFLVPGDVVRIEMRGAFGESLFGAIENRVAGWPPAGP